MRKRDAIKNSSNCNSWIFHQREWMCVCLSFFLLVLEGNQKELPFGTTELTYPKIGLVSPKRRSHFEWWCAVETHTVPIACQEMQTQMLASYNEMRINKEWAISKKKENSHDLIKFKAYFAKCKVCSTKAFKKSGSLWECVVAVGIFFG